MTWKLKALWRGAPKPVSVIQPAPRVYSEHVAILRSIQAPEDVIKIAEDVAEANRLSTVTKS